MDKKRLIPHLKAAFLLLVILILLAVPLLVYNPFPKTQTIEVIGTGYIAPVTLPISLSQDVVDINDGDIAKLSTLPNIGPKLAQAIIDERKANGPFFYPEDLLAVRGIGEKTVAGIIAYFLGGPIP